MGRRKVSISILLLLVFVITRCSGLFVLRKPLPDVTSQDMYGEIREHALGLRTYEAKGQVMAVSSQGGFRGSVRIVGKLPDSLCMRVEGPLGIDVLRGLFGGGRVVLYYPRENIAYEGTMQTMQESGFIPTGIPSQHVLWGMMGLIVPEALANTNTVLDSTGSRSYFFQTAEGEALWVQSEGPVVTRWEKKNVEDVLLWEWEGERFRKSRGVRLPRVVKMTRYQPRERITFFYEHVRANGRTKPDWFDIQIPEGVETIAL